MALSTKAAANKDVRTGKSEMQHRHFATVAAILRMLPLDTQTQEKVARHFADELADCNPRFDRSRFLKAALPTGEDFMTSHEAWLYAATWGSAMTSGDPGAVMYGFDEKFVMQSEDHRHKVLRWIQEECYPRVLESPADYDADELKQMDRFIAAVRIAPVAKD